MSKGIHKLYDKRQKKPVVYRVNEYNEDITMKEIVTMRLGKCKLHLCSINTLF